MPTKRMLSGDGFAHEAITVADSAVGFTATTYDNVQTPHKRAVCTLEGGIVRYRYDGTAPTSTTGHLLAHGDSVIIEGGINIKNFQAIRAGDVSGTLRVTYEAVHG